MLAEGSKIARGFSLQVPEGGAIYTLEIPEENSFASLALYSRRDERQQWQNRCEKPFYQLRFDQLLDEDTPMYLCPGCRQALAAGGGGGRCRFRQGDMADSGLCLSAPETQFYRPEPTTFSARLWLWKAWQRTAKICHRCCGCGRPRWWTGRRCSRSPRRGGRGGRGRGSMANHWQMHRGLGDGFSRPTLMAA